MEDGLRLAAQDYLRKSIHPSLTLGHLSLGFQTQRLKDLSLNPSPEVSIYIPQIRIEISLKEFLPLAGSKQFIKIVQIDSPQLTVCSPAGGDTTRNLLNEYSPYPLENLSQLSFIKELALNQGTIRWGSDSLRIMDELFGSCETSASGQVRLNLTGHIPQLPGATIKLYGNADLSEGSFRVEARAAAADIGAWIGLDSLASLCDLNGSVQIEVKVRGEEDLSIIGSLTARNLQGSWGRHLHFNNGALKVNLSGFRAEGIGSMELNGLVLPFALQMDLAPSFQWGAQLKTAVDLSDFKLGSLNNWSGSGTVDLDGEASGSGNCRQGLIKLSSEEVRWNSFSLNNLRAVLEAKADNLTLTESSAEILGGKLNASGSLSLTSAMGELEWEYINAQPVGDSSRFLRAGEKNVHLAGLFKCRKGVWSGSGEGVWRDSLNQNQLLGSYIWENHKLNLQIRTPLPDNYLTLTYNKTSTPLPYRIQGCNLDQLIKTIGKEELIPRGLEKYRLDLNGSGRQDSLRASVVIRGGMHRRIAEAEGFARLEDWQTWSGSGRFWLDAPSAGLLIGSFDHQKTAEALTLSDITLSDNQGQQLLAGDVRWDSDFVSWPAANIDFQNLPFISILQLLQPERWSGYSGIVSGNAGIQADTLNINLNGFLKYPDSTQIAVQLQGRAAERGIIISDFCLDDPLRQETVFRFQGGCDFGGGKWYDSKLSFNQFPLEQLAQALIPQSAARPRGKVNGRLTLKGDYNNPDLNGDFHISQGALYDSTGYWLNLQVESLPESYIIKSFSLGRNLRKLIKGSGQFDRRTRLLNADITGTAVDFQEIETIIWGRPEPLKGEGSLDLKLTGPNPWGAHLSVDLQPGRIGPLGFERLKASAALNERKGGDYIVRVDSAAIDWGDCRSRISGIVPLSRFDSLDLTLEAQGRLTGLLPRLTGFFSKPKGEGRLDLHLGGSLNQPLVDKGCWEIRNGGLEMNQVIESIEKLQILVEMDSTREIHIRRFQGETDGRKFSISNRFPESEDNAEPIIIGGYNLGIIQFSTEKDGIWMTIPGLMKPIWGGSLTFTGAQGKGAFEFQGPASRPLGQGEVYVRSATFTYPLLKGSGKSSPVADELLRILETTRWDALIIPEWGNRYQNELGGLKGMRLPGAVREGFSSALDYVDIGLFLDLLLDNDPEGLHFSGSLSDTLRIDGELTSSRGSIEYLDLKFQVEDLGLQFNPLDPYPILYGTAVTTFIDSSGRARDIRLVIAREFNLQSEVLLPEEETGGRWGDIRLRLEDDQGHSQEQILALLGYAPEILGDKLTSLGSVVLESAVPMRQWTRFVEQKVEKWLRVDQFKIEPTITKNIIERKLYPNPAENAAESESFNYLTAWDRSQVTVGKALTRDLFVSYTGSLLSGTNSYNLTRLGVVHTWDLRLRLRRLAPNFNLSYRYIYDGLTELDDHSVRLSYSFFIKP